MSITVEDAKLILGDNYTDSEYQAFVQVIQRSPHKKAVKSHLLPILHTFKELIPFFDLRHALKRDFCLSNEYFQA